jgi:trigger factor
LKETDRSEPVLSYKLKNLKKVEKNKVFLDLEITSNYLKKSLNDAYREISSKAKIPGFRQGKIPYNIIDLNFGKEYVLSEAANIAISELYPQIIEESKIKPIDYPKIKINNIKEDETLDFEVTVEVEPEIEPPKYKGIEVTGLSEQVFDDEIETQLDNLKNNYATLEAVEDDRTAQTGDFVIIDFAGKIDGEDFEGNSAQDYTLEIGSKTLFEEFEKTLTGMKKGEHKDVSIVLPSDIANRDLAGKEAQFSIDIKEIKKKILPEINEEFLGNFGDYKSVEELKDFIGGKILEKKKKSRREKLIADLLNSLVDSSSFDVPEPMIESRIKQYEEDLQKYLDQNKISRADYLKVFNLSSEQLKENFRKSSITETKEYLILSALEKTEGKNIEPLEEQVKSEKEKALDAYQKEDEKKKLQEYLDSKEGNEDLVATIRRRNLFDLLIKNAKIKEDSEEEKSGKKKLWVPGAENKRESEDS